jgi:geranylgeranyl reductase family protein
MIRAGWGILQSVSSEVDLVVVGAGPGGSSAAAAALAGGLSVLQFEAASFPRVKPCAGGLTPKAVGALPLALAPSLVGSAFEFEFNAWRGTRTVYGFRAPVLTMVSRPALDQRLVEANRARVGFELADGEPVRAIEWRAPWFVVQSARREVRARQLVGADGANGIVNRLFRAAEPRGRALAVELVLAREDLVHDPELRPCFDFGAVPRGYGWVFPKERELSVGLFTLARGLKDLRARLGAYLAAKGFRWRGDPLASFEAHTIPLGGDRPRALGLPLYLVGDAAGFADALTGEGIYHALASGRIAGELAATVARGAARPEEYARRLERPVLADTRWSWRCAGAFHRHPALALRALRRSPLWRALVHGTGSGATFSACLRAAPLFWLASRREDSARCWIEA